MRCRRRGRRRRRRRGPRAGVSPSTNSEIEPRLGRYLGRYCQIDVATKVRHLFVQMQFLHKKSVDAENQGILFLILTWQRKGRFPREMCINSLPGIILTQSSVRGRMGQKSHDLFVSKGSGATRLFLGSGGGDQLSI